MKISKINGKRSLFPIILILLFILPVTFFSNTVNALEDNYHINLRSQLDSDYGISGGTWILHDNEADNMVNWGGNGLIETTTVTGLPFSQKIVAECPETQVNNWDFSFSTNLVNQINTGDVGLIVYWARYITAETDTAYSHVLIEQLDTWDKSVYQAMDISINWEQYFIPFEGALTHTSGDSHFQFNIGHQAQRIEIGGANILNYGNSYTLTELEEKFLTYNGRDPNAQWRTEAADRINTYRKNELTIRTVDNLGQPIQGATINVEMTQHDFIFGTAIAADYMTGTSSDQVQYQAKLNNLDGEGHGFNGIVFENAMKWRSWESAGTSGQQKVIDIVDWAVANNIEIKGHNLVWPSTQYLPDDLQNNQDTNYIQNRVEDHIQEIAGHQDLAGKIYEWDVINEPVHCTDLQEVFNGTTPTYQTGEEVYEEWFALAQQADPNAKLSYNEYGIVSHGGSNFGTQDHYKELIQAMVDQNLIDGIGVQGHMSTSLTSIEKVYDVINDFAQFGLEMSLSEYDAAGLEGELDADYTRDFLTIVFSHPIMRSFYMWGFWDGRHWLDDATIYNQDWSLKPSGQAFIDLVFNEWWTNEDGISNNEGNFQVPDKAFKGTYNIIASYDGHIVEQEISLTEDMVLDIIIPITQTNIAPSISSPMDIEYVQGDRGNQISWTLTDDNPATYTITSSAGTSLPEIWSDGEIISISVDELSLGTHSYTITASDTEGLTDNDQVNVVVVEQTQEGGDVWMGDVSNIRVGDIFETTIFVDTGIQLVAAYGFEITYDPTILQVSSVVASPGGFLAAAYFDNNIGTITIAGFDISGKGPDSMLDLVVISWEGIAEGTSPIGIQINDLTDEMTNNIGTPLGIGNTITILPEFELGDVNHDDAINIVDALLVAQFYVGEPVDIDEILADVNLDDSVNIVDALLIAQYYVGQISSFPLP